MAKDKWFRADLVGKVSKWELRNHVEGIFGVIKNPSFKERGEHNFWQPPLLIIPRGMKKKKKKKRSAQGRWKKEEPST